MKLAEIQIDRCGVWRDLALPLSPDGLSVLFGPNEAGKSTLVEFIRGVLYGFASLRDAAHDDAAWHAAAAGSLLLEGREGPRRVHRSAAGATRGAPRLIADEATYPATEFLSDVLSGIDDRTFRAVFAVDLREIQDLGTLTGGEAGARIYDASLGPDGRRLLEAGRRAQSQRSRLVDPLQQDGELVRLFERHDQLNAQLHELDERRRQYADSCLRRDQLETQVADLRRRQAGIHEQLRGHLFLERAGEPWRQIREWRRELSQIPAIAGFPERGVERLEQIETELAAAAETRDHLLAAANGLRQRLRESAGNRLLSTRYGAMQGIVAQRDSLVELEERREAAKRQVDEAELACVSALESLGDGWTGERLAELDLSPAGWQTLSGTARSLELLGLRRRTLKRQCRRLASAWRELRDSLAECLHDLPGGSVEAAIADARERLRRMSHLVRQQLRETELDQRRFSLEEQLTRIAPQLTLPRWVHVVLGLFAFMGIVLAGTGLVTGATTSGIAGAIYAFLGVTCGGLAFGLKAQYQGDARERMLETDAQLAAVLADLRDVRTSIDESTGGPGDPSANESKAAAPVDGGDLVRRAAERVAELADLAQHQRKVNSMRRRLDDVRRKREIADREFDTAEANWGELLEELGLPETIPAGEALEAWQRFLDAREVLRRGEQARSTYKAIDDLWNASRRRIAEIGRRSGLLDDDCQDPLDVLATWERQLADLARLRTQRRDLKSEIRAHRREAALHQSRVDELKVRRDALLVQGGAASREEFEVRGGHIARQYELESRCEVVQGELEAVCAEHADLALVEDDLLAFDSRENADRIATLQLEAADLERDLDRALDDLTEVELEIRLAEDDRQGASLRFEREQVRRRLLQAARDWAVVETAAQAGDDLRRDFERRHQPSALVGASRFLSRLTAGRYPSVWTPLGERRLMVDDEQGRSLPVASLSRGTREQLFLAVRLAIVDDLAHKGVSFPLILDDVLGNFDERRAEAAAETLFEFAREGRQVLFFTCHLHLARLFQSKGIEPIWLPDHRPAEERRDEHRRAG